MEMDTGNLQVDIIATWKSVSIGQLPHKLSKLDGRW